MKPSFLLALLFVLAALFGAVSPAPAASLRTSVVVEGDTVKIGDIFEDAGPMADTPLFYAPAPGRRVTLDANWLARAAAAYRISWRPLSMADRAVVERAGRVISTADLLAPLTRELEAQGMQPHSVVEFNNRQMEVSVPLDVPAIVGVSNLSYDAPTGRFNVVLTIGGNAPGMQRVTAQGRVFSSSPAVVLKRAMNPGEIIRKEDVDVVYRRDDQIGRDIIADPARLIGTTPRQRLRAGDPIREGEARAPIVITRNTQVIIKLEWGSMTLTTQGKALEDGSRGDVIRVTNLQSGKTLEGRVAGPDVVLVGGSPSLAALR